jgi:hypothetical protein
MTTDPTPDESDRDRVLRLIMARCPELAPSDLAMIGPTLM